MDAAEKTRLEKLIGMLGSSFDGERANAARKITEMAETRKLTVNELIAQMVQPANQQRQQSPPPPPPQDDFTDLNKADDLLRRLKRIADKPALAARVLTQWEINFATDVSQKYAHDYDLSDKQLNIVDRILRKSQRAFPRDGT